MSQLLLDSQVFIWLLRETYRIGPISTALIKDSQTTYISAASVWEIYIKKGTGKLRLPASSLEAIAKGGFTELPVTGKHAEATLDIKMLHKDPFDQLLVAQAYIEGLNFLTADKKILDLNLPYVINAKD